ncbi:lipopolysaccharide export system permease protein [Pseudochelatococcus lubricantis]|uniref:Lipopolysaccharide export system permease protein n=1 Tax=Pseudochelatococcus lubricantis TaxID=1538102 RepID=A0ABX0V0M9_9HYPH|nr:LPS export ABC transporter permease LptG [Pseudochelatococcus lubricantis]NIJ57370.1 lipopolysaccharide export system permease protein [Pseudochelatococcus lubricantis]
MLIGPTLGRYFGRRFLLTIGTVFGTVFVLVYTLDFVELMRRAGEAPGASAHVMAWLSFLRTPSVTEEVLPFAVLFGSIATLLNLSRRLELVIARSVGVSAWGFLQPPVIVALLLGVVSVTLYNPLSASLRQRAATLEATVFSQGAAPGRENIWIRQKSVDGQAILRASSAIDETATLMNVTVFLFDGNGGFQERIEAASAKLYDGHWELEKARVMTLDEEPQAYDTYLLATTLAPAQVRQSFTNASSVSFWDLPGLIERTEQAGLDARPYRLQYEVLLARPLLLVAMVLVAASVSLRFFRFGGVAKLVLGGVAAGFVLYVVTEIMQDLGGAGILSPTIAAWFSGVVGSLLGVLALLYQEDG